MLLSHFSLIFLLAQIGFSFSLHWLWSSFPCLSWDHVRDILCENTFNLSYSDDAIELREVGIYVYMSYRKYLPSVFRLDTFAAAILITSFVYAARANILCLKWSSHMLLISSNGFLNILKLLMLREYINFHKFGSGDFSK